MKILLSAHACEPNCGSEEGVGWNTAWETAKHHETWVLTRPRYKAAIEAELLHQAMPNLHFVYFEAFPFTHIDPWRLGHLTGQLHYYLWQLKAYFVVRRLSQEITFNVVRHVTYVKYWSPSFVSLLPTPFIWGPVGGGESAPKAFWKDFSLRGKIYEFLRETGQRICELDPFTRLTASRSVLVLTTTQDTAHRVIKMGATEVQVLSEAGLTKSEIEKLSQLTLPCSSPIRFISMGRLLHWKGYHLAIRAFHQVQLPDAEYWILGDGAEREQLQQLINELGIDEQVKLLGRLPRDKSLSLLGECQILLHPSLHDSGGWTCLEAMAAGRPVICLDLGGPSVQITSETGIKVPAHDPEQAVRGLADAMVQLTSDPARRIQMGSAGRQRVNENFSWEVKGQFFAQMYQQVLSFETQVAKQLLITTTKSK